MKSLSVWILGFVASPVGVVILAALDSTVFVSLPLGIDAAVVMLAARTRTMWWLAPLLATAGSLVGAALTFWMGIKIGEHGLEHHVPPKQLARARRMIGNAGAMRLAALDLLPPPFPFTPFILAAGALKASRSTFFATLAVCRLLRFGVEAWLARIYGSGILSWLVSDTFHDAVMAFTLLAFALTLVAGVRLFTSSRQRRRAATA